MFAKVEDYAATKIQAGIRGYQARKSVKSLRESLTEETSVNAAPKDAHSEAPLDAPGGAVNEEPSTESSKYTPGYFELHGIESEQEDNTLRSMQEDTTLSSMKTQDLASIGNYL